MLNQLVDLLKFFGANRSNFLGNLISKKVTYSPSFRLFAQILNLALNQQILNEKELRMEPNSPKPQLKIETVRGIKQSKSFTNFGRIIEDGLNFVENSENHFGSMEKLLILLIDGLFSSATYVKVAKELMEF